MAEERPRPDRAGRRRRLPGFVRRRPFAWAFAAALVAGWLISDLARGWRFDVASDAAVWLTFAGQAVALALAAVVALRWRGVGWRARAAALAVCALWWTNESGRVGMAAREMREFIPNMRVVKEMLHEPRRAVRTEPGSAAAKALAAGDSSFLAVGGTCGSVPGVDSAVARRQGVRVITGTYHDGPPLTAEHRAFQWDALLYAERYNDAVAERLGIEAIPPGGERSSCFDPTPMRGRAPLFWP
jgi:hypothetical protein